MTRNAIKLAMAVVLMTAGIVEFVVRREAIGVALVVVGLALVGMVLDKRLSGPRARARRRREDDGGPS